MIDFGDSYGLGDWIDNLFKPVWYRPFKESDAYTVYSVKNGYMVVFNVLGVDPKDLKISYKTWNDGNADPATQYGIKITIDGETELSEIKQHYAVKYGVNFSTSNHKILDVQSKVKNGLALIYVKVAEPAKELKESSGEKNLSALPDDKDFDF